MNHTAAKSLGALPFDIDPSLVRHSSFAWLPPLALILFLSYLSGLHFLLFHTLAELFTIAVAVLAAVVAWNTFPFSRNHLLMFLGCGYLWIGVLDLIHALTYTGMGIYPVDTSNMTAQFWIAARYLEALVLLAAPTFLGRGCSRRSGFLAFAALSLGLYWLIVNGLFPDAHLAGIGSTPFKTGSEYVVIALLTLALARMWRHRETLGSPLFPLLAGAIVFTTAEVALVNYVRIYDQAIVPGHLAKLLSFWLLFVATVRLTLTEPFRAMAHDADSYDAVPDPIAVVDRRGRLRSLNRAARALAERDSEHRLDPCIGRHVHTRLHPPALRIHDCPVCRAIHHGETLTAEPLYFHQEQRWYSVTLGPIESPLQVAGMVHVMRDITGETLAKKALEESEARNRAILAEAGDAIVLTDDEGRLVDANRHAERLLGFSREELLAMTPFDFHPEEEHQQIRDNFAALARDELVTTTHRARHKDGTLVPVEIVANSVQVGGRRYMLGIFRDQRQRLHAEERERRLEARLARTERLSAAGEIATSLAHELNQPLAAVVNFAGGCVNRLRRGESDPEVLIPALEQIVNQGRQAGATIHRLRAFLSGDDQEPTPVPPARLVGDTLALLDGKLRRAQVRVEQRLDHLPPLFGDPLQLQQVLINLINNAIDVLEPLEPEQRIVEIDGHEVSDGRVELRIHDHGPGISEAGIQRIFEPFHTTREGSLGMGLAVCRTIVEAHQGRIEANNEEGLTLRVTLPIA